jgi:sugar (pentulose or hexulose) kinase
VTGTSTLLAAHSEKPLIDPSIQNLRHAVDGWIPFTILDCGGMSIKWCRDLLSSIVGEEISWDRLVELASEAPAGSDGLIFYPYMLGERRSENTICRGGFLGITLNHKGPHFARAVIEAVALVLGKDIAQFRKLGLEVNRILSVGGGTRNDLLNMAKASIARVPLEISPEPEAGLKGAAILGAAGVGIIDDPTKTAVERRQSSKTIEPDDSMLEVYASALDEFIRIYDHMLGFWMRG